MNKVTQPTPYPAFQFFIWEKKYQKKGNIFSLRVLKWVRWSETLVHEFPLV